MLNWWQRQKARKIVPQLRLVVLRPTKKEGLHEYLKDLPARIRTGLPSEQFSEELSRILGDRAIFMGYIRRGDKRLYRHDGSPTGETLQSGDVLDEIAEFQKALDAGAYARA
jgi:hypothetical protein